MVSCFEYKSCFLTLFLSLSFGAKVVTTKNNMELDVTQIRRILTEDNTTSDDGV